jgi:hypothetical protein
MHHRNPDAEAREPLLQRTVDQISKGKLEDALENQDSITALSFPIRRSPLLAGSDNRADHE